MSSEDNSKNAGFITQENVKEEICPMDSLTDSNQGDSEQLSSGDKSSKEERVEELTREREDQRATCTQNSDQEEIARLKKENQSLNKEIESLKAENAMLLAIVKKGYLETTPSPQHPSSQFSNSHSLLTYNSKHANQKQLNKKKHEIKIQSIVELEDVKQVSLTVTELNTQRVFKIVVPSIATVGELKVTIQKDHKIPTEQQIILTTRKVNDNETLEDIGALSTNSLKLVLLAVRKGFSNSMIKLTVKLGTVSRIISAYPSDYISRIKERIWRAFNELKIWVHPEEQVLIFKGIILENTKQLADYEIQDGFTIYLNESDAERTLK